MMTADVILHCAYLLLGGAVTPWLIVRLFAIDAARGASAEPAPTFIMIVGVLLLWPVLALLIFTENLGEDHEP